MKVEELRIGNLVYGNLGVETVIDLDTLCYMEVNQKAFTPIPLTQEWAIKLGFKEMKTFKKGYWIILDYMDISLHYTIDGLFMWAGNKKTKLFRYVHEVQNLYYALTREELSI